mmetsp:Transcript_84796/g.169401  ORF Transcript_84796/g.169401 Transcript_84796/m.169401 type:complete len:110 (+) Transcript_84796:1136-1465(+)
MAIPCCERRGSEAACRDERVLFAGAHAHARICTCSGTVGEKLEMTLARGEKLSLLTEIYYLLYPRDWDEPWPKQEHLETDSGGRCPDEREAFDVATAARTASLSSAPLL